MSKTKSADLILKLYETRREPVMRDARVWFAGFFPESAEDIMNTLMNPEVSHFYRMVLSYWDMAASFVNHGAIDEKMFMEVSGEIVVVFCKIEPFLAELREITKRPQMLQNIEALVMRQPGAKDLLTSQREMMKMWMQNSKEAANSAA
jgi:hypothetical protein